MKKNILVPAAFAALSIVISCNKDGGSGGGGGGSDASFVPKVGQTIPAWEEGVFDIHFINTPASGEATFLIYPDGTQMLIDAAGSIQATGPVGSVSNVGIRQRWEPAGIKGKTKDADVTFNFGNFIAEYIRHCQQWTGRSKIDYVMLTHLHNDHFGGINNYTQKSKDGKFSLQSLAFILDRFEVGLIADRGYPLYNYPFTLYTSDGPSNWSNVANWKKAVEDMVSKGVKAEMFDVGSTTQFAPAVNKGKYNNFTALNLGANGKVWTGSGIKATFPEAKDITCKDHKKPAATDNCPEENHCSAVMKFSYGKFDYYASADMQYDGKSSFSWKDVDALMAQHCGEVDVMKAGHHGTTNTNGTGTGQAITFLKPQCIIYCGWTDGHPREDTFKKIVEFRGNITDHYITNSCAEMRKYDKYAARVKGDDGHVLVRVAPGGDKYYVCMVTDSDGTYTVKSVNEYNSK